MPDRDENNEKPSKGLAALVGWSVVVAIGGTAAWAYHQQDFVAAAVLGFVAFGAILGCMSGGVKYFSFLAAIGAGIYGTPFVETVLAPYVSPTLVNIGLAKPHWQAAFYGCLIGFVVCFFVNRIGNRLVKGNSLLAELNGIAGLALGGVQATGAALLLLCGLLSIEPRLQTTADAQAAAGTPSMAARLLQVTTATKTSRVYPYLKQYDPFEHYPALRQAIADLQTSTNQTLDSKVQALVRSQMTSGGAQSAELAQALKQVENLEQPADPNAPRTYSNSPLANSSGAPNQQVDLQQLLRSLGSR